MNRMKRLGPLALLPLLALGPAAFGQAGGTSLRNHDTDAPVDVAADRIEVQDRADRAIFSGDVDVRQGNMRLRAARLIVSYADGQGIDIKRLEASGGVILTSPSETASGQYAIYDLDRRLVTMIGGVSLVRGANRVQGGRLVIDLDSGRAVMDGGSASTGGRVTGRFTVPERRDAD